MASSSKKRARNMRQSQLITSIPSANNIEKMDTAIADFLLSNALPPSLSECPKLKLLIQAAKHLPIISYEWHARYSIRQPVLCNLAMIVLSKPLGIVHLRGVGKMPRRFYRPQEIGRNMVGLSR